MASEIGQNNDEIIIYQSKDGKIKLDVRLENRMVWLSIDQMAELYDKARSTIDKHIFYATSVDYDPRTEASRLFFKMVQNNKGRRLEQTTILYNIIYD